MKLLIPFLLVTTLSHAQSATPEAIERRALVDDPSSGAGVSFGFENGIFGSGSGQGVKVKTPLGRHFALSTRVLAVNASDAPWQLGGRLELVGQTPVFLGLMRLYGGGGPQYFYEFDTQQSSWGGGGQFGFEFFLNRGMAFYIEIGGNGGGLAASGATALAGLNLYPF